MEMATIEEFNDMLGELPKKVANDPYYEKEFLQIMNSLLARKGEAWVREHAQMCLSQWVYVETLV
jgi:hypothetical protein